MFAVLSRRKNTSLVAAVFAATVLFLSGESMAAATLTFDDDAQDQDGVITHTAGGVATGTGIDFVSIRGLDTPLNDGAALSCVSCELTFTTGALITQGPAVWEWGAGGTFELTGTAEDGGGVVASGTLLTGTFDRAIATGLGTSLTFSGFGTDTKNQDLLDYYGIPAEAADDFIFANTELSLGAASVQQDGSFTANVTNADLDNSVPVPASLGLLGVGLIGLGMALLRRRAPAGQSVH